MGRNGASNPRALVIAMLYLYFFSTRTMHKKMSSLTAGNYDDAPHFDPKTKPKPVTTLVHMDPFFMGGFRNQHMRFIAFVSHAVQHNITQILLPSLRWMDSYNRPHSARHELLFDVQYWNSRAEALGLPMLVDYDPNVLEGIAMTPGNNETATVIPCWNETSGLYSGLDEVHIRNANMRRTNVWNMIGQAEPFSHCRRDLGTENNPEKIKEAARADGGSTNTTYRFTHLVPHGGAMLLWNHYNGMQRSRRGASDLGVHPEHVPVERAIYELIRPSKYLRFAAENAIEEAIRNATKNNHEGGRPPRLLALHPRIEQEMMTHRCNKYMERNLTRVFERIQTFPPFLEASNSSGGYRFDLVFIALSKSEVEKEPAGNKLKFAEVLNQNRDALYHARAHGLFDGSSGAGIPIVESGTDTASKVQFPRTQPSDNAPEDTRYVSPESLGVLELVASIINFFTAVQADIFIGVKGSSYSTDAFSVRHYQRKEEGGAENYLVGADGINRLYGPPSGHSCD